MVQMKLKSAVESEDEPPVTSDNELACELN
jgi:hypothetical protein